MNKQQRYLLLVLLAKTVSGAQAMELDVIPHEEVKDKFEILKSKLSPARTQELYDTMDMFIEDDSTTVISAAYSAAIELVRDGNLIHRDKTLLKDRADLRKELKKRGESSQTLIDDLSGSDDESTPVNPKAPYSNVVRRVHLRDTRLATLAKAPYPIKTQQAALKLEESKRTLELSKLVAIKQPLAAQAHELYEQTVAVSNAQDTNTAQQEAVEQLMKWSRVHIQNEPLLAEAEPELLKPVLDGKLKVEEQKLSVELAKLIALKAALDAQIEPLTAQEALLTEQQKQNLAIQADLEGKLTGIQKDCERTELAKATLLLALDQELELIIQRKQDIELAIAQLNFLPKPAQSVEEKKSEGEQLEARKADLVQAQAAISHVKVARAQADGTYTSAKYYLGYYK